MKAELFEADLRGGNLKDTNLEGANLLCAHLPLSIFEACVDDETNLDEAYIYTDEGELILASLSVNDNEKIELSNAAAARILFNVKSWAEEVKVITLSDFIARMAREHNAQIDAEQKPSTEPKTAAPQPE